MNCLNCTHLIIIIYFLACRWRWTGFRCSRPRWCPCLWTSSHYARTLNCTSRVCVTLNLWRVCLQTGPEWIHSPLTSLGHRTQGRSISLSVIFSQLKTFPPRWVSRKICVLESLCQVLILKNWQRPACFFSRFLTFKSLSDGERERKLIVLVRMSHNCVVALRSSWGNDCGQGREGYRERDRSEGRNVSSCSYLADLMSTRSLSGTWIWVVDILCCVGDSISEQPLLKHNSHSWNETQKQSSQNTHVLTQGPFLFMAWWEI